MHSTNKFWEITYKKNIGKLIGTCYRYVNDYQLAEDLTHDAFIAAINKEQTFKGKGEFEAWLRRIVVNTALMHIRKKHTDLYANHLTMHENKAMELHDDENEKDWVEQADFSKEELLETIKLLPEHHNLVFNLYVIDGYTHQQIGEKLGISAGTSKSHLARARKKLQQILNKKALKKQRKKDWKRALILLIWPDKSKAIDTLYKEKFIGFKLAPKNPIAIKDLNINKMASPIAEKALITSKGIVTAFLATTIAGSIYVITNSANHTTVEQKKVATIDTVIELEEPIDNIKQPIVQDTIPEKTPKEDNLTLPKNTPVVIKKQRIKKTPVIIKKAVIINDSTNAE